LTLLVEHFHFTCRTLWWVDR